MQYVLQSLLGFLCLAFTHEATYPGVETMIYASSDPARGITVGGAIGRADVGTNNGLIHRCATARGLP